MGRVLISDLEELTANEELCFPAWDLRNTNFARILIRAPKNKGRKGRRTGGREED